MDSRRSPSVKSGCNENDADGPGNEQNLVSLNVSVSTEGIENVALSSFFALLNVSAGTDEAEAETWS